jgi:YegS/Rv2252/BmrU family lipid kinase
MTAALTLVVNPAAGGGKPARYLPVVTAFLDASGARYTVCESTSLDHARAVAAAAAARRETVVAFGGDGLTGALAGAAASAGRGAAGFAIIPAGRGNDFARTLGIPFEPAAAARVLLDGVPRPVDLLAVTGADGAEAIVAGSVYVGIASVAGQIANRARLIRGPLVYNLAALRALLRWQPTRFRVGTTGSDGQRASEEFSGYVVVVANLPYFGAGMKVAPAADCGDGLLDIVIMRHGPKLTFIRALTKIKDGSHVGLAQVATLRASAAELTADRPLPVGADGETLPVRPPLRIRVLPAAINVIAPRPATAR